MENAYYYLVAHGLLIILLFIIVLMLATRLAKLREAFERYTADVAEWARVWEVKQGTLLERVLKIENKIDEEKQRLRNDDEAVVKTFADLGQRVTDLENHNIRKATAAPKKGTARAKVAQVKEESSSGTHGDGGSVLSGDSKS